MFKILATAVLIVGTATALFAQNREIQIFENALAPVFQLKGKEQTFNMFDRMQKYNVPAVSVAIIDDHKIAWSHAWGFSDKIANKKVTRHTLFQAASISKPVTAFSVMQMVDAEKLDLETPINHYLKSWQLADTDLTMKTPVTLKHILSHTAGITVHGFPGYELGSSYPITKDIVSGSGTANTNAVVVDFEPGTKWRYSGGGYTVMQLAIEDYTKKPFPQFINNFTLKPLGMEESFFDFIIPEEKKNLLAAGHLPNGEKVKGGYVVHPESAAASLWATPRDIAKFALSMLKAWKGDSDAILSIMAAQEMLTHIKGGYGLGFALEMNDDKVIGFKHGGANVGFRAYMVTLLEGKGAIVMTNSDNGMPLIEEVLSAAANIYDWSIYQSETKNWRSATNKEKALFSGRYSFDFNGREIRFNVSAHEKGFVVESPENLPATEFFIAKSAGSITHLFAQTGMSFSFSMNEAGQPVMNVWGNQAKRLPIQH